MQMHSAQPGAQDRTLSGRDRETQFALTAGVSGSDNIGRMPDNEQSGTIGQAGVIVGFAQQSRRVRSDVQANAVYERYFDDNFDDGVVGGVDANLRLGLVPERFDWVVQENFGQITTDPFSAATPDNRENINYFTTGPDFTVRLGGAMSMLLSGRYSDLQYETSDLDSRRYGGTLALIRQLSGTSTLGLNVMGEQIDFDTEGPTEDYDRYEAFLRYAVEGARGGLSMDLGYTAVDQRNKTDGLLARVDLSRRVSASSAIAFSAGTQFSDSGDLFRDTQNHRGVSRESQSIILSSVPFRVNSAALSWEFQRNRTGFGARAEIGDEDYEDLSDLERTVAVYSIFASRELSRFLQMRVFIALNHEDFDVGFKDDEINAGASLAWLIGRNLQLQFQYDYFDRDSTAGDTGYKENRASLFLAWSPIARQ